MNLNCPAIPAGLQHAWPLAKAVPPGPALARETKFIGEPPSAVSEEGVFEGYASVFDQPDLGKDVVVRGAFADSLARRGVRGVRMLWQHDPAEPVGRWLSLVEDGRGLKVRGQLNLAVGRAREIRSLLKDGAIDGLSIGFRVERARTDKATGHRRLEKLDLLGNLARHLPDAARSPGRRREARAAGVGPPTRRRNPSPGGVDPQRGPAPVPAPGRREDGAAERALTRGFLLARNGLRSAPVALSAEAGSASPEKGL